MTIILNPVCRTCGCHATIAAGYTWVGGAFTTIQGQTRYGLAQLDPAGVVTSWTCDIKFSTLSGTVVTLALDEPNGVLYVGGRFTTINGVASDLTGVAAIDMFTGAQITNWAIRGYVPPVTVAEVHAIDLTSGVYMGGSFGGGTPSTITEAIQTGAYPARGNLTSFLPPFDSIGTVDDLKVVGSSVAWVCGTWITYNGLSNRTILIGLNPTDGTEVATSLPRPVLTKRLAATPSAKALALDGTYVYVGGSFDSVGSAPSTTLCNVARFDAVSGAWDSGFVPFVGDRPFGSGQVLALWRDSAALYIGGSIGDVNGTPRTGLSAISTVDGSTLAFGPVLTGPGGLNPFINDVTVIGGYVYAVGRLATVDGVSRGSGAKLATDGTLQSWDPQADTDILCVAVSQGL